MIELKDYNGKKYASAKELHTYLEIKRRFSIWIKEAVRIAKLIEEKDFVTYKLQSTGGRPTIEYWLIESASMKVVLQSRMPKSINLVDYLIGLYKKEQNFDLLPHDKIIGLSALIGFFKYIDNQKEVETKHKNEYVKDNFSKYSFAEFHQYRNKALEIEPNIIDQKIKEYCVINSRALPNMNNKHAKIQFLDMYKNLRNAVWDFMEIKGQINSLKLANLAEKMAKAGNLELFDNNQKAIV